MGCRARNRIQWTGAAGPGAFQPHRLARPDLRDHRRQQPAGRFLQARPVRRGRCVGRRQPAAVEADLPRPQERQDPVGSHGLRGHAKREAPHEGHLRQLHAGHRWESGDRLLRFAGIVCVRSGGKLLWKRDLGKLNVGAYDLPEYEWGTASSPILYEDKVIVQCDQQKGSFLEAFDRQTGSHGLESRARRTAFLGHAGGLSGARADGTGDERFEFRARVRSIDGQRACGVWAGVPRSPRPRRSSRMA
jgi:hypothetical protein